MPDNQLLTYLVSKNFHSKADLRNRSLPAEFSLAIVRMDEELDDIKRVLFIHELRDTDLIAAVTKIANLFVEPSEGNDLYLNGVRPHELEFEIKCAQDPNLDPVLGWLKRLEYKVLVREPDEFSSHSTAEIHDEVGHISFGKPGTKLLQKVLSVTDGELAKFREIVDKNSDWRLNEINEAVTFGSQRTLIFPLWMILDEFLSPDYGFQWENPRTEIEEKICAIYGVGSGNGVWHKIPS